VDVDTLFETIEVSNYLGGRNKAEFERYQEKSPNRSSEGHMTGFNRGCRGRSKYRSEEAVEGGEDIDLDETIE
jgi:hypothetical protein